MNKTAQTKSTDTKTAAPKGALPEIGLAEKLFFAKLLSEMLMSGEYELEFPDDLIAGKFANRVARLEARVAELEAAAGKPKVAVPVERADAAKLAKAGGKGGK